MIAMNDQTQNEEILDIIKAHSQKDLQEQLLDYHPSDIAEVFEILNEDDRLFLIQTLNHHLLAEIFEHLDEEIAAIYFNKIEKQKVARILDVMDLDDAADILNELDDDVSQQYLDLLEEETKDALEQLSQYEEDTAGGLMTPQFIALQKGMDVKDAMKALIHNATSTEGIQRLFVIDDNGFLEGVVELKALIQARSPLSIDELMQTDVITAKVTDDDEAVARVIQNYGIYLLPVVNEKFQLQGVITMDDAADILDAETDEDYAKFANISSDEGVNDSFLKSALHRLPWLTLLLFLGLIISGIISSFEATLSQITVLVFFQPLILDMAGNTGTQSLAVTVRGLSKDYFNHKDVIYKHIFKELRVGMLNGLAIGALSLLTTTVFLTIIGSGEHEPVLIGLTVGLSAAVSLSLASVFGAFFPLFLHKINIDPAVASGPFITTLNDILGLIIYFTLAALIILNI